MGNLTKVTLIVGIFLTTGCVENIDPHLFSHPNENQNQSKPLVFKTNESDFIYQLKDIHSPKERNAFMDEFLLKSDMQCSLFLNAPFSSKEETEQNDSLYMALFDTASSLFGMKYITDTAKAVFLNSQGESTQKKEAYANALSPEIRKGVEISRSRYAKSMIEKKELPLEKYGVNDLKKDMLMYDKQCSNTSGLMEINRALKEMQSQLNRTKIVPTRATVSPIDPQAIKQGVTKATKKVQEIEQHKQKAPLQNEEGNQTIPMATLPTLSI